MGAKFYPDCLGVQNSAICYFANSLLLAKIYLHM
nr:MAG TPA: hypothetical protein [Caudoviricetes sp.]